MTQTENVVITGWVLWCLKTIYEMLGTSIKKIQESTVQQFRNYQCGLSLRISWDSTLCRKFTKYFTQGKVYQIYQVVKHSLKRQVFSSVR